MFKEFEDQRHHLEVLHIALMESIETQQIQGRFKMCGFWCQTVESSAIHVAILKSTVFLKTSFLSW